MNPFAYRRAEDAAGAAAMVADNPGAAFLGGGTNLVDHMKLGVAAPDVLVDITHLPMDEVEALPEGGVRIGANVRNSDLAAHPLIRRRYPVLSQALLSGASGQLRNLATTAGNLLQRTRCVYFQDTSTPCNKREPGTGCSALDGYQRYHAILGASPDCVATHPSDMAVALTALDAQVVVQDAAVERRVPIARLHRLPGEAPEHDTVLNHGDLITAVELPDMPMAVHARYRKVRDRASFAFALVSVAATMALGADGAVSDVRIALGGVAHKPWRALRAEEALRDGPATEERFAAAAEAELAEARPLPGNTFKVALARSAITATLRQVHAEVLGGDGHGGPGGRGEEQG
ncbi:FAD binding domain-containing protein [Streptomonospora nanhaiensis]|uniref:Xanthine dehydrogenase YagS FAD-binding subunit n=1 Tax=Streptomonospora nanhaiensis TaxID=1323731 RepID=A0A853BGC1_9ACTN|nr:xanthine dehydrogenase family protein subunit M [Streptomonospora nanhaiensis]MBV2366781.1 xanthine dehydrogenase family protein subunit M [Streptomonospora nanhaiensis]MBX9391063.1 xanthine dehydrogenase family protein subunit M [Streptomonospora nanhaiensis]NYI94389.1 xanthine dehydrogenase YagS FAD-binding subunit [Streptomonospora nanhaiensis]